MGRKEWVRNGTENGDWIVLRWEGVRDRRGSGQEERGRGRGSDEGRMGKNGRKSLEEGRDND